MEMSIIIAFHYIDEVSFDEATGTVLVSFLGPLVRLGVFFGVPHRGWVWTGTFLRPTHTHTHAFVLIGCST